MTPEKCVGALFDDDLSLECSLEGQLAGVDVRDQLPPHIRDEVFLEGGTGPTGGLLELELEGLEGGDGRVTGLAREDVPKTKGVAKGADALGVRGDAGAKNLRAGGDEGAEGAGVVIDRLELGLLKRAKAA